MYTKQRTDKFKLQKNLYNIKYIIFYIIVKGIEILNIYYLFNLHK